VLRPGFLSPIQHTSSRQLHVLGSVYEVQNELNGERRPSYAPIGLDMRVVEVHSPSPRLKLARPCSQNVFHPVTLRSVGESDEVSVVSAKGVDGSAVGTAGFSTDVVHDRKPRQVSGYLQGQPVGETPVEASYASRCGQLASSFQKPMTKRLRSGEWGAAFATAAPLPVPPTTGPGSGRASCSSVPGPPRRRRSPVRPQ
jgi:hypothetical protein